MNTFSNQKVIKVNHPRVNWERNHEQVTVLVVSQLEQAMQKLKTNAFKLYMYMAENMDGYEFALSKVDVTKKCGMGKDAYESAVKELIEVGYLYETSSNHYTFYTDLHEVEIQRAEKEQENLFLQQQNRVKITGTRW